MTKAELERDLVILACAVSAGIHGALAPAHYREGAGAGLGFVLAAAALAGVVLWLTARPASRPALAAAATVLAGMLASYALAATTGLPLLHPGPEPVDALALVAKAIETTGLAAAAGLLLRPLATVSLDPKGT